MATASKAQFCLAANEHSSIPPSKAQPLLDELSAMEDAIKVAYTARAVRGQVFGQIALNDGAWTILLFLALARCEERSVTVGEACQNARSSISTALRQLDCLCDRRLAERIPNPSDRRTAYIAITAFGQRKLLDYLNLLRIPSPPPLAIRPTPLALI